MPPIEVAFLVEQLLEDQSSHLFAAVADLTYPWSRELTAAADLWDLTVAVHNHSGKPAPPYPRPIRRSRPVIDPEAMRAAADAARAAGWTLPPELVQRRINQLGR